MRVRLLSVAVNAVHLWTRLYTWRMATTLRERRLAEIESDLWEFQHDSTASRGASQAVHLLIRLLLGIPSDFAWRAEQTVVTGDVRWRRRAVRSTASAPTAATTTTTTNTLRGSAL